MPRRLIPWVIIVTVGVSVGFFGGFVNGEGWYHGGEAILFFGLLLWYAIEFWKRPLSVVEIIDATEGDPSQSFEHRDTGERHELQSTRGKNNSAF